jgi:hypothetical protein
MTTTYKTVNYETAEDLRNAINTEFAALAYPYTVKHKIYGEGQLTFVKVPLSGSAIYATVDFAAGTKTLSLDMAFAKNLLEMPETLTDILLEAQTVYKADFIERENEQRLADRLAREQAKEAEKQAKAAKEAEEKYEKIKTKALKDFNNLVDTVVPKSTADEFYYSLGWLAKHAGTVAAALPDYLESSFIGHFGNTTSCRVVDSKKRYPSGWTAQWTWAFTIALKKPKQISTVPAFLADKLNPSGKAVSDTAFIWDLVDNYGFQFGKTQDLDKIRSHVPSDKLSFFEAGLA